MLLYTLLLNAFSTVIRKGHCAFLLSRMFCLLFHSAELILHFKVSKFTFSGLLYV